MNPSAHDKTLADHHPRPQFELSPLDSRRQNDNPHNYRDSNFDPYFRTSQSRPTNHQSTLQNNQAHLQASTTHPMKSTVMHQQQPHSAAIASMQSYPPGSMGFSNMPDTQQSATSSYPPQPNGHRHLPNTMSLHQPQHNQHQPIPQHPSHSQHQPPPPPRSDVQSKMAPPQHNTIRRFLPHQRPNQQLSGKPSDQVTNVQQSNMLPHMPKVQPSLHMMPQPGQQVPPRFQQHTSSHIPGRVSKGESIPAVPLPMHPDPVQSFQPTQEVNEGERGFTFSRHGLFDEFPHDEHPNPVGLHPSHASQDTDQGNTLAGVDSITGHLGMPGVASISNLPIQGMAPGQGAPLHGVPGFGGPTSLGNAAISGGASEIAETLVLDRKGAPHQRRVRPVARMRNQQMSESQRKQRHNEHTRASRSRIDKGLDRLKKTLRKVKPQLKVTKKADVLQEAVKMIKEGYRLPPTESDDERDEPPQESSLSV